MSTFPPLGGTQVMQPLYVLVYNALQVSIGWMLLLNVPFSWDSWMNYGPTRVTRPLSVMMRGMVSTRFAPVVFLRWLFSFVFNFLGQTAAYVMGFLSICMLLFNTYPTGRADWNKPEFGGKGWKYVVNGSEAMTVAVGVGLLLVLKAVVRSQSWQYTDPVEGERGITSLARMVFHLTPFGWIYRFAKGIESRAYSYRVNDDGRMRVFLNDKEISEAEDIRRLNMDARALTIIAQTADTVISLTLIVMYSLQLMWIYNRPELTPAILGTAQHQVLTAAYIMILVALVFRWVGGTAMVGAVLAGGRADGLYQAPTKMRAMADTDRVLVGYDALPSAIVVSNTDQTPPLFVDPYSHGTIATMNFDITLILGMSFTGATFFNVLQVNDVLPFIRTLIVYGLPLGFSLAYGRKGWRVWADYFLTTYFVVQSAMGVEGYFFGGTNTGCNPNLAPNCQRYLSVFDSNLFNLPANPQAQDQWRNVVLSYAWISVAFMIAFYVKGLLWSVPWKRMEGSATGFMYFILGIIQYPALAVEGGLGFVGLTAVQGMLGLVVPTTIKGMSDSLNTGTVSQRFTAWFFLMLFIATLFAAGTWGILSAASDWYDQTSSLNGGGTAAPTTPTIAPTMAPTSAPTASPTTTPPTSSPTAPTPAPV